MNKTETAPQIRQATPFVRTESIKKTYWLGDVAVEALNTESCDLVVRQGEFVAIMGSSGSGKSTLLHILGGIDRPNAGKVWVGGDCLSTMDETQLALFRRDKVGFVFQFFNLIPTLTVEENVALPLLIAGRYSARASTRISELLDEVELAARRLHKPSQLSGGERQRVAIARAFAADPKIILMDEPTGNLDSITGTRILQLLTETQRTYHKTIIMVTHSPMAAAHAERTIFLRDGAIVASLERCTADQYDAEAINQRLLQF